MQFFDNIYSVEQIRKSEELTMLNEPISSIDLMERAGSRFTQKMIDEGYLPKYQEIVVVCGTGNNGGDGLVIARQLQNANWPVRVLLAQKEVICATREFEINLNRWYDNDPDNWEKRTSTFHEGDNLRSDRRTLLIDAIFGIGLSRPLSGYYASVVEALNKSSHTILAVDVPSGMYPDRHTDEKDISVKATMTYTFQFHKLGYLLPENHRRCGKVSIVDIGLMHPYKCGPRELFVMNKKMASIFLEPLNKYAHKGSMGHGLLIAGSANMPGAAIMSATAAMRGGIGKLTVHSPSKVCDLLPTALPEAILSRDPDDESFSGIDLEKHPDISAIAIGCGLGKSKATVQGLKNLLHEVKSPIILDADALNILAEHKTWLAFLPSKSILTPHVKEFERLAGKAANDFDRIEKLKKFAVKHDVIVILKGAHTAVATPNNEVFFNMTGNPGMATAGSGDVLTGLLLALLSQGYLPSIAAMLAVWLHGAAGDCAARHLGDPTAIIASDLPMYFGEAVSEIRK